MSEPISPVTAPQQSNTAIDPAIFKILEDGTVLYKTYQQAENAAKQLKTGRPAGDGIKKLSQVKYGEKYQAKDGQVLPYTLGQLAEFQFTGLIVVIIVLAGLSLICMAIGRLIAMLERKKTVTPAAATNIVAPSEPTTSHGIHPGLTDQQLVVILTAAASKAIGSPVRIDSFR